MIMKNTKLVSGLVLFMLGLSGVLSMLTMEIPLSEDVLNLLLEKFTLQQIEFLKLANPLMMLTGAVVLGVLFHEKVHLEVPLIMGILEKSHGYHLSSIFKYGVVGGLIAGILLTVIAVVFTSISPKEITELAVSMKPTFAARFLYGGFTEEILMRFGLMTFIIYLLSRLFKSFHKRIYWTGILLTAFIFALSHLPITYQTLGSPSIAVLSYILIGNSTGGVIFGWLYWKKGLETAFIAHIAAHIVMVLAGSL
jgi:hypothetical protein